MDSVVVPERNNDELGHYRALGRTLKRRNLPDDEVTALHYARVLVAERLLDE
jgi:tRNA isopentenyl-2-thiomethyl-A-37 hydroxylase MiaE